MTSSSLRRIEQICKVNPSWSICLELCLSTHLLSFNAPKLLKLNHFIVLKPNQIIQSIFYI
jgi:DNA-binding XRE family transcriptional regulator